MIIDEQKAIKELLAGKVIGVPTDTVYGFAVIEENIEELYKLKHREHSKKIVRLIPNISYIKEADEILLKEMEKNWPGNITYIYKVNNDFESFRIPNEENLLNLLNNINGYLYVSSANVSGEKPCVTKEEFEKRFPEIGLLKEEVDTVKDHKPSKIYRYDKGIFERIR